MGFKLPNKITEGQVKIMNSTNPELIGKIGIVQRVNISRSVANVKLESGDIVEVPIKDLSKKID